MVGRGGEDDPCHVGPRMKVRHVGRDIELSAAQVLAMLLSYLRKEVEAAHGDDNILNTVISVPAWFGRAQRALVMDAARIARCPTPACVTDGTALALGYGLLNMVSMKKGQEGGREGSAFRGFWLRIVGEYHFYGMAFSSCLFPSLQLSLPLTEGRRARQGGRVCGHWPCRDTSHSCEGVGGEVRGRDGGRERREGRNESRTVLTHVL